MAERKFKVVVAGAGVAGLFMAEKLKNAGIDFTVYEKASDLGGTWRDNTYPGLFVDVLSRQYEFPFAPNYDWSRKYAPSTEILEYVRKVADRRGLRKFIKFNEEIVEAKFNGDGWRLKTAKGEVIDADVFIAATGFLHTPVYPNIPGRETFKGPAFHSARWDHSIPYKGKRWGIIGGGASGIQITEALAWAGAEVTQFIRRAQWVHIRENPKSTLWERLFLRLPGAYQYRQRQLWDMIIKMDAWRLKPGPAREAMEREYKGYLDVIKDPELRKKLTPDYHLGCTRIPKSDQNYYEAVQLPNVKVETRRITKIVPDGVELADGSHEPFDVLVYATGFDPHAYMRPMKVIGQNGITPDDIWKDRVYSYGGIALPGFPNMFMLYGPFSPVNNVPVPLGLDQEIGYIMKLIDMARKRNVTIAPTMGATQKFVAKLDAAFPGTVWLGCNNWYSDQQGTPVLWPLRQDEHKSFFEEVDESHLEIAPAKQAVA
ncbi:MAG TPA: NAD(P)/FAD-dependent oxidoreductase [Xanthobacteraceae bacterium]|nr:NAD(P)/FAD-dependent oxidoreductase [Xanthobacteraceae bacterium]